MRVVEIAVAITAPMAPYIGINSIFNNMLSPRPSTEAGKL